MSGLTGSKTAETKTTARNAKETTKRSQGNAKHEERDTKSMKEKLGSGTVSAGIAQPACKHCIGATCRPRLLARMFLSG